MSNFNIATICTVDSWLWTHLARFTYFAKKAMPEAHLNVVLIAAPNLSVEVLRKVKDVVAVHFQKVVFQQLPQSNPPLLAYDRLRAHLPTILALPELLYVDPDVDLVESVTDIPAIDEKAQLFWTADPIRVQAMEHDIGMMGFPVTHPPLQAGFLYMRRSFLPDFLEYEQRAEVNRASPMLGSAIWNIIKADPEVRNVELPQTYHATTRDMHAALHARAIHHSGPMKFWRPYADYSLMQRDPMKREMILAADKHDYTSIIPVIPEVQNAWKAVRGNSNADDWAAVGELVRYSPRPNDQRPG